MKNKLPNISLFFLLIFIFGCATIQKPGSVKNKDQVFESTFQDTYAALIKSLQDAGYSFQIQDPKTGEIETGWKPETSLLAGLFVGKLRTIIHVIPYYIQDKQTRVHVDIIVQKEVKPGQWEPVELVRQKDYDQFFAGVQENLISMKSK